jgi:ribosome-binding ATPase
MKLAIIGVENSGRSTIFSALTQRGQGAGQENRVAVVQVPDPRVDRLSELFKPKKVSYAQVEFSMPASDVGKDAKESAWNEVRTADALVLVARNFALGAAPCPMAEVLELVREMVFSDFVVIEKKIERLDADKKRGKTVDPKEWELLQSCKQVLEQDQPVRSNPELAASPMLRGYTLLSGKPVMVLFNNSDEDLELPAAEAEKIQAECLVVRGKLECEIAGMAEDERAEFMREYGITESVMDRVIRRSYELLGLMSFFTVGEDEVKAWTIRRGTPAVEAAGVIHSDIQKGFIRAEVVSYDGFIEAGSQAEARKRGQFRLEGKTYQVADGDIINFRFNV